VVPEPDEEIPKPHDGVHQETVFHTSVGQRMLRGDIVAECLLDYVLFWLTEGTAGRDCLTYEAYLLAVIAIVGEYCAENGGGELSPVRSAHGRDFPVFLFDSESSEGVKPRSNAEGYRHPALNRDRFEFYKVRIAREDNERRMKQLVKDITAATQ
jgi:hypothetical protein